MTLANLHLSGTSDLVDITVQGKYIQKVESVNSHSQQSASLSFNNATVLPGLINSHDHLDFNLFPQLGDRLYNSYREWAAYIHERCKDEIAAVLKVPEELRVQWGIYKNLMCGFTTVVNHGKKLEEKNDLVTVLQNYQSLHSVAFEKNLLWQLNNPANRKKLVAIHVGEGTDAVTLNETDTLIKWNLFKRTLVGMHGVNMSTKQAKSFKGLVWCPASNYFMFNKTADVNSLQNVTSICFGSDSTLTSSWNIWKHFEMAKQYGITDNELLKMLTINPAKLWGLNSGLIAEGKDANIVIANHNVSLFNITPEQIKLVVHEGEIKLYDDSLHEELHRKHIINNNFFPVKIGNSIKYVKGNIHQLVKKIRSYYPNVKLPVKLVHNAPVLND